MNRKLNEKSRRIQTYARLTAEIDPTLPKGVQSPDTTDTVHLFVITAIFLNWYHHDQKPISENLLLKYIREAGMKFDYPNIHTLMVDLHYDGIVAWIKGGYIPSQAFRDLVTKYIETNKLVQEIKETPEPTREFTNIWVPPDLRVTDVDTK